MTLKKTKKRSKKNRMHGRKMGTHGHGARKKWKKSGHRGGVGMSGTGKRADHKKTLINKLYGHDYFGKQGITSKKTKRDKRKRINLEQIESDIESYIKRGLAKKTEKGFEITLEKYKILGGPKDFKLKARLIIKANDSSKSARREVEEKGGEIILIRSPKNGQTKAKEASKSAIEKVKKREGELILSGKKLTK